MKLRKNKKTNEIGRRVSNNMPDNSNVKYSYHSARSKTESNFSRNNRDANYEEKEKSKKRWVKHIPTYVIVLVIIASIIYSLTLTTKPRVVVVGQTSQTIMQPIATYEQAAQKMLQSSLQNRTKITINTDSIANKLEAQFPELNGVSIIIPLTGRQPQLEIRPSASIFVLSNPQGQYLINQQGNAVIKLGGDLVNNNNLPTITDNTGFNVILGKQALSTTSVTFMKTVVDQFNAKGISIQKMTLSTTPYELDVQVRGVPYFIKFNLLTDPLYATGTYFSVLKQFNPSNPVPSQYIDIRIPGRAYYK